MIQTFFFFTTTMISFQWCCLRLKLMVLCGSIRSDNFFEQQDNSGQDEQANLQQSSNKIAFFFIKRKCGWSDIDITEKQSKTTG